MEKKSLKTYKTWAILLAVVTMVLGLIMIFWPGISAVAICYLMGAVCIAAGIYEIIRYFDLGLIGVLFRYDLFLGIMSVLAGVLLLLHPNGALVILPVILGFYIILRACSLSRSRRKPVISASPAGGARCCSASRARFSAC